MIWVLTKINQAFSLVMYGILYRHDIDQDIDIFLKFDTRPSNATMFHIPQEVWIINEFLVVLSLFLYILISLYSWWSVVDLMECQVIRNWLENDAPCNWHCFTNQLITWAFWLHYLILNAKVKICYWWFMVYMKFVW